MPARIRLRKISRTSKGHYNFRVVVVDQHKPRDGKHIEQLGYYDPSKNPPALKIITERYDHWVKQGAVPTETVASLYKRYKKSNV